MKPPESLHDWMEARVEAYLDGALPADEQARFEQGLVADADWDTELLLARQIRDGLHTLPEPECPPHVTQAVLAQVRREARYAWLERFHAWVQQQFAALWQPALAMTVVVLLVVSASLIGRPTPPPTTYAEAEITYGDAEIQQALAEVKLALGMLSEVSRQTGKVVRDDVIADRVVGNVQNAFKTRQQRPDDTQR